MIVAKKDNSLIYVDNFLYLIFCRSCDREKIELEKSGVEPGKCINKSMKVACVTQMCELRFESSVRAVDWTSDKPMSHVAADMAHRITLSA
jgi:hypothetical protein